MSHTTTARGTAGLITHATALIRGAADADLSVYHARTEHARIAVLWGGLLLNIYSAAAAQGLFEAFVAARQAAVRVPRELPAVGTPECRFARPIVAMEWTYRPTYAVVPQSGRTRTGNQVMHWVDLHTGPITWQIRDRVGLVSAIETLAQVHRTAVGIFLDGAEHAQDPAADDYPHTRQHA
ncbi:hypothetical protein [Mycobacterium sp. GA-2829]|uniref:hypothetical protein n=1 Tax=Mycobacterium sp. GA-2829 TaxID=1772283 RepID=UPI00073FD1BD|nr:hypothetical protein [Mycobacterium sp. GA-2829]KUI34192.1 hypothetical protein AU194_17735 [Mycobacterium sp. GA-2829]